MQLADGNPSNLDLPSVEYGKLLDGCRVVAFLLAVAAHPIFFASEGHETVLDSFGWRDQTDDLRGDMC